MGKFYHSQPEDFSAWRAILEGWRDGSASIPKSVSRDGQTRAAFSLEWMEGGVKKTPSHPFGLFLVPEQHHVYHCFLTVTEIKVQFRLEYQRGEMFLQDEWLHQPLLRVEFTYRSATPGFPNDELTMLVEVQEDKPEVYQAAILLGKGIPDPEYAAIIQQEMENHHVGWVLRWLNELLGMNPS